MALRENLTRFIQFLKIPGKIERDRVYDLIVRIPRLLIVELLDLGVDDQMVGPAIARGHEDDPKG
uniref:Uncharacterized protein n=1 Tax=Peronospora matthiolae TaxID=2874970 RepID=A0AAV1T1E6_9STRA